MPRIIPDIENRILNATRGRLVREGNRNFSMRSIAEECGISAGSIYNYYRSKYDLAAAVVVCDWKKVLAEMTDRAENAESFAQGMEEIRRTAASFIDTYRAAWNMFAGGARTIELQNKYHTVILRDVMGPVGTLAYRFGGRRLSNLSRLLSELVLSSAMYRDIHPGELKQMCAYFVKEKESYEQF